jgi:hypothetical protein
MSGEILPALTSKLGLYFDFYFSRRQSSPSCHRLQGNWPLTPASSLLDIPIQMLPSKVKDFIVYPDFIGCGSIFELLVRFELIGSVVRLSVGDF